LYSNQQSNRVNPGAVVDLTRSSPILCSQDAPPAGRAGIPARWARAATAA
jgi:hypothetical protein